MDRGVYGWLAEYFPEFGYCAQRYRFWKYVRQRYHQEDILIVSDYQLESAFVPSLLFLFVL